jgi:hypothetical protein
MKPWTRDLILGVGLLAFMGTAIILTQPAALFLIWLAGLASGYGLRIAVVNVWPHIFRPRMSYNDQRNQVSGKG